MNIDSHRFALAAVFFVSVGQGKTHQYRCRGILAGLTGLASGDLLTPAAVARLLLHRQGGLKRIPERAAVSILITHATPERQAAVAQLAHLLQTTARVSGVYMAQRPGAWQQASTHLHPPQT
jgi:hypothetical protein